MSNNKQTPVWLSVVIAFLLLVIAALLVLLLIYKIGALNSCPNLSPENWFSYIVTLIGVLITLFIGFQIFNIVEIRREIKDAELKYKKIYKEAEESNNKMQDIFNKWEIINEKQDESRKALSQAFLLFSNQYDDNELKLQLLLYCIEIYPWFETNNSVLSMLLDDILVIIVKIDKFRKDTIQNKAKCLRNIHLDNYKNKEDIEKKINKILYLIDEKTHLAEGEDKQQINE